MRRLGLLPLLMALLLAACSSAAPSSAPSAPPAAPPAVTAAEPDAAEPAAKPPVSSESRSGDSDPAPPSGDQASRPAPPIEGETSGGSSAAPTPDPDPAPAPSLPPSPPALHGCLAAAPGVPDDARLVTVKRAVDGDTLELSDGTRVRLTGINTPESVDPRRPVEWMGKEASAYTASLVTGQEIFLQPSRTPVDRYGRTLAWLWLPDGVFLNAKLVYDGYAQVYTFSDNPDHAELLRQCEREAREAERGLWAPLPDEETPAPPAGEPDVPPPLDPPAAPSGLTILSEPGAVVPGNGASITVQTTPGAQCQIVVRYKSGPSKAKGLEPKTARDDGRVSWHWTVGRNTTPGDWPVTVTCDGQSVQATLTVK